ncbi:MAG: hypothetical protein V4458_12885 [Pseudomonadota bacterium]|jgi:hypothetical protein
MAEIKDCLTYFPTACPQVAGEPQAGSSQLLNRGFPHGGKALTKRKSTGYPQGCPQLFNSLAGLFK